MKMVRQIGPTSESNGAYHPKIFSLSGDNIGPAIIRPQELACTKYNFYHKIENVGRWLRACQWHIYD